MHHGVLGGGEPLGADTDELAVADGHGPHGADHPLVDGLDDDAGLGVGDAVGGVQGLVGAAPHEVAAHQGVQGGVAGGIDLVGIVKVADVVPVQHGQLEGAGQDDGGVLAGHLGHGIEVLLGGAGGDHAHIQGGLDGLHIVVVAGDVEVVAHPLGGHHVAVGVDVGAVVHDRVVVGPAEVLGQTDHEVAPGHGVVHLDGVGAGGLAGVQGDVVGAVAQHPGQLHVIAAHAVPHDGGAVGVHGDQMLVAGAPGALGLHLAVEHGNQLDGLHELQGIGLAGHVLGHAVQIDTVALTAHGLLGLGGLGGGDDPAGQDGGDPQAGRAEGEALHKVSSGDAAVHILIFTAHCLIPPHF